ncbi:hypothetical protein [Deinococcus sp.]|uniref:hypothetical protein n=1 Tax=Deinococcus sp. TaxID=47478 RepID=UPI003C798AF0
MNIWRWLTTADPSPRYTSGKIARIVARFVLFLILVTLVQALLAATPWRNFFRGFLGSALVVFVLYIPFARILILDTPGAARQGQGSGRGAAAKPSAAAVRRKERNRFAGVKKGPPGGGRGGGRR